MYSYPIGHSGVPQNVKGGRGVLPLTGCTYPLWVVHIVYIIVRHVFHATTGVPYVRVLVVDDAIIHCEGVII